MSYDISTGGSSQTPCDHLQLLERYTLDTSDFRTLHYKSNVSYNMRAPINGVDMVRLYFKGVLVSPNDPNYGYSLIADPARVYAGYSFLKIAFNKPIRLVNPLIEITYLTRQAFCLKCGGTGRVVDWAVSNAGQLLRVVKEGKLGQQALKYILTSVNPFNPSLVCPVRSYIGNKVLASETEQDISTAILNILAQYQAIQKSQATVQTLQPQEMLKDIEAVNVSANPDNPTQLNLSVSIEAYQQTNPISLNATLQTN